MIDLNNYRLELGANLDRSLLLLAGLSAEELNWKEGEQWSLLQIAEHILLTEEMVMGILSDGSSELAEKLELFGNNKLKDLLVNLRNHKVKTQRNLEPQGSIRNVEEFQSAMRLSRDTLVSNLKSGEWMVSTETYTHPMLGEMTVSDWLYFLLHHAERHQWQMKDRLAELGDAKAIQ